MSVPTVVGILSVYLTHRTFHLNIDLYDAPADDPIHRLTKGNNGPNGRGNYNTAQYLIVGLLS